MIYNIVAPMWFWCLAAIGFLVLIICSVLAVGVLYHILRGFVLACNFYKFLQKVAKADGTEKPFRVRRFLSMWLHFVGWNNRGDSITLPRGHKYKGYNNYVIVGKFVSDLYVHEPFHTDEDDEDE